MWKAALKNMLSHTNEPEKDQTPILDIEGLRIINGIVRPIKERILRDRSRLGEHPEP